MVSSKKEANLKKQATLRQEIENLIGIFQQAGSNAAFLEIQDRQKELQKLMNQPMYQSTMPNITNYDVYIKSQSNPIPVRGRPKKEVEDKPIEIIQPSKPRGRPPKPQVEEEPKQPKPRGRPKKINITEVLMLPEPPKQQQPKPIQTKAQESNKKDIASKKRKDVLDEIDKRIKMHGETSELKSMRTLFKIMNDDEIIHTNPKFIDEIKLKPKPQKKLKIGVKKIKETESKIATQEDEINKMLDLIRNDKKEIKEIQKKPQKKSQKIMTQSEMDKDMESMFKSTNAKTKQIINDLKIKQTIKDLDLKIESQKEKILMKKKLIDDTQEEIKNMMKKVKDEKEKLDNVLKELNTKKSKTSKTKKPKTETYEKFFHRLQLLFNADEYAVEDKELIMENLEKRKLSVDEIKSVFLGAVAHYQKFYKELEQLRDDYEYSAEVYKEQGEPYDTEAEIDDKLQEFIADQPTIKWSYLINFSKNNPNYKLPVRGSGVFSLDGLERAFEGVDWTANRLKSSLKGYVMGRGDAYPPYVKTIIEKYGDQEIVGLTLSRNPIDSAIISVLNVLSLGKLNKRLERAGYDKMFHLRLNVKLQNGKTISIEKNPLINMEVSPKNLPKAEFKEVYNIPQGITLFNLLEAAQSKMGSKYFTYSTSTNNCQNYVMNLLTASNIGDTEDIAFLKQDVEQLFQKYGYLKNITDKITDTAARANEIYYGAGFCC